MTTISTPGDELIAAIDLGTNSARMSLVRLHLQTATWSLVSQHKETVRLGQGEFSTAIAPTGVEDAASEGDTATDGETATKNNDSGIGGHLTDEAMVRAGAALRRFAEMARGRGAREIVAVGTAALREAENRDVFIESVRAESDIHIEVVSGIEEARLIYLGVASGVEIGERTALFIDIGGGSTELILGTQTQHKMLDSLKMGAIRVAGRFLAGITEPVSPDLYHAMRQYVRSVLVPAQRKIEQIGFDLAIASSGTAMNLAATNAKRLETSGRTLTNPYMLNQTDLRETAEYLCALTLEQRRSVPGLNPERADIIIAGAAILQTILEELDIAVVQVAERSLREGIIEDALLRRSVRAQGTFEAGVRRRSVEELMRRTQAEFPHAAHVARLTRRMYDDLARLGRHDYDTDALEEWRDLLEYAALLHDVGVFVAHTGHHRHSYYLIKHAEMAGFTIGEKDILANLAYFHRKSSPSRKRHPHFADLPAESQTPVRRLAALLRVAEGLDRSHLSLVQDIRFTATASEANEAAEEFMGEPGLTLTVVAKAEPSLEMWYIEGERSEFEAAWGAPLKIVYAEQESAVALSQSERR